MERRERIAAAHSEEGPREAVLLLAADDSSDVGDPASLCSCRVSRGEETPHGVAGRVLLGLGRSHDHDVFSIFFLTFF